VADRVVVDASVAVAYLRSEVATVQVQAALTAWQSAPADLLVPSHFWIEVANVLVGRRKVAPDQAIAAFVDLDGLGLRTIEPDRPLLLLAIDRMVRFGLSAYDAIYLALALSTDSKLATLDRRLAEAAGDAAWLIGSSGVSESRAPYETDRPDYTGWAHTAVVGAHIAELRKKALADA
jgi:predicted nucleic acid-binding protein